ncbi:MAG: T9SS type A sorting domain-containing protein, partial [bacterium]
NGHIWAGTAAGVFRSMDNGDHWTPMHTGLPGNAVQTLAINTNGHVFAGTGSGVFRFSEGGASWEEINTGLQNKGVTALAINSPGRLFAGTSGSGVFRSIASTTRVNETAVNAPTAFLLEQNYPNPFNPSTVIRFSLPREAFVRLKVINLQGEEVATLVNGVRRAGGHTAVFEPKNLSSGIYFYVLQSGEARLTRRILFLK